MKRKHLRVVWLLVAGLTVVHALPVLVAERREVDLWQQVIRLLGLFFPPDWRVLPEVMRALNETVQIATLSTLFAVLLALPLAALGSARSGWPLTVGIARFVLVAIRSIPSLVWAVICVALVGTSALAGVYALAIYSVGYLGKFFIEAMDQLEPGSSLWLRSQGAGPLQVFRFAIWPSIRGSLLSQTLWMWEYNIRSASIIGYVGAGGLGLQLHIFQEYGQWDRFATVLLVIFFVVAVLEVVSLYLKRALTRHRPA